jgi:thermopsin
MGVAVLCVLSPALMGVREVGGDVASEPALQSSQPKAPAVSNALANPSDGSSKNLTALQKERLIVDTLRKDGVPSRAIYLPNIMAEGIHGAGHVVEGYTQAPAPMGVADIGIRNDSNHLTAYEIDTSSAKGEINLVSANSSYIDGLGPDTFGVQLNTVLTGVTLFGNPVYQFWTQNVVNYTISTHEMSFVDNIWNFSSLSGYMSANTFYTHSKNGTNVPPTYYFGLGPTLTVGLPFRLDLYINASIWKDRPIVYFNYTVASSTLGPNQVSGCYDFAVFNSTSAKVPKAPSPPAYFQVNGYQYAPNGLIDDIELDTIGNDDGTTTTFYGINATLAISHWNATTETFDPEPAAYNVGSDTGETSEGVESYWMPGTAPIAHLAPGPSFLGGLWNVSGSPGVYQVTQRLSPANAFIFANPGKSENVSASQWIPTSPTGTTTFVLPRGTEYYFEYLMSEYQPFGDVVNPAQNRTVNTTMVMDTSYGVYTPLVAWGNAELANISSSGTGSPTDPYVLYNNEYQPLYPQFTDWNDFLFPVFDGILLVGTNASVDITPPSFSVVYPKWLLAPAESYLTGIPSTNNLQMQFLDTENVALLNASSISGWFWFDTGLGIMPLASVMFWDSSNNLVAGNTFEDEGSSLFLYGGTGNTIWGNIFLDSPPPATNPSIILYSGSATMGLSEVESGDMIFNNFFSVPLPAQTYGTDPTTNATEKYTEVWNVPRQPANDYRYVCGVNLTGSIIDTNYQGGNYWSNYGTQTDPFGILPYNDGGQIHYGGDAVPLIPFTLYAVTAWETGLAVGSHWSFTTNGVEYNTRGPTIVFYGPNGTFAYNVTVPANYAGTINGTYTINGEAMYVDLQFSLQTSSGLSQGQVGLLLLGLIALTVLLFFMVVTLAVSRAERVKHLLEKPPEEKVTTSTVQGKIDGKEPPAEDQTSSEDSEKSSPES